MRNGMAKPAVYILLCSACVLAFFGVRRSISNDHAAEKSNLHSRAVPADRGLRAGRHLKSPLVFEENAGRAGKRVKFLARSGQSAVLLTPQEAMVVPQLARVDLSGTAGQKRLGIQLIGSNPAARLQGVEQTSARTNYFIGNDPTKWKTNIRSYRHVKVAEVYPGIDLIYYGAGRDLEHDFVIAPGQKPEAIRMRVSGADSVRLDSDGGLRIETDAGTASLHQPTIYQERDGHREIVAGGYVLLAANEIGFEVGKYNTSRPLIIDPILIFSTYLGGADDDAAGGVAFDSQGNIYVVGSTASTNFPLQNPFQSTPPATLCGTAPNTFRCGVGFVSKFDPTGQTLIFSTYFGGTGQGEGAQSVAVDSMGDVFVAGTTSASDFPATPGAFSTTYAGGICPGFQCREAYIAKFNPTGSKLLYSTYLGSVGDTAVQEGSLAIDQAGNAYVTGGTSSTTFPTTPGAFQTSCTSCVKAFVTKLNPTGSALVYSTYLGGSNLDNGNAIAVDGFGSAYVTGFTSSTDFPLVQALQSTVSDGFVTKLKPDGSGLIYSTYLGSSGGSETLINAIAVDSSGAAYVGGLTNGQNFPTTPGAFQPSPPINCSMGICGFVSKINSSGTALSYSTYLTGATVTSSNPDTRILGIAVDPFGHAYVTGSTNETDFPTLNPVQGVFGGGVCGSPRHPCNDAFISGFNNSGSALVFSTYMGGSGDDEGVAVAVDGTGAVYAVGETGSPNFPTMNPFQSMYGGGTCINGPCFDAYVVKLQPPAPSLAPNVLSFPDENSGSSSPPQPATLKNPGAQALNILSATTTGDFALMANANSCGNSVAANMSCNLNVIFSPTTSGQRIGTLMVKHDAAGGPLTVALQGMATAPAVMLSTGNLTFNGQLVGSTSASQPVMITDNGTGPLAISNASASGDFAVTNSCPAMVTVGNNCSLNVTFTPTATGTRMGSVSITDNAPGSPQMIALTGTGANLSLGAASGGSTSMSVTSGQNAKFNLQAGPSDATAAVNLSVDCSTVPASTCSVMPNMINLTPGSAVPFAVNVATQPFSNGAAPTGTVLRYIPPALGSHTVIWSVILLLTCIASFSQARARRRVTSFHAVAAVVGLVFLIALAACGGSGGGGAHGTPPNTYNVVVTASSQGAMQKLNLTLKVQ